MRYQWISFVLGLCLVATKSLFLNGCSSFSESDCNNPNTLSGFVYVQKTALSENDGTLEDDVLVSDRPTPPTDFQPLAGATVKVEETGQSLTTGERGAFVFHPLPAGTYTLVITVKDYSPVRRYKNVCVRKVRPVYIYDSSYYRPPYYYDPPLRPDDSRPTEYTSGSWGGEGFSSLGDGGGASARTKGDKTIDRWQVKDSD